VGSARGETVASVTTESHLMPRLHEAAVSLHLRGVRCHLAENPTGGEARDGWPDHRSDPEDLQRGVRQLSHCIQELLNTFEDQGRNTLDIPLLNALRIKDIWRSRASAKHFQAFLVDGLVRWNEDRAAAAAPPPSAAEGQLGPLHSYSGHLKHVLNQKSQRVLGLQMVKDFTTPAEYTEYLYQQTGRVLEDVSLDPDTPDEAAAIEERRGG
ncbi:uncharacterized protein LOC129115871, partial [Anoplopoma fimbria]|uniref:uncharacterized protein LOC129115871 n=1 Tax=Anoplopoma fimbria TaxID=229290 RepID=UPI0023EAD98B